MNNQQIPICKSTKYLGIEIQENLNWETHIRNISGKANRTLGVIRRNFSKAKFDTRKQLYLSLVRPQLEYAAPAWDPYKQKDIDALEANQNRALGFICQDFDRMSSISLMRQRAKLSRLETRRNCKRLQCFYDFRNGFLVINDFPQLFNASSRSRPTVIHSDVIEIPFYPYTDYLKQSFLYRALIS